MALRIVSLVAIPFLLLQCTPAAAERPASFHESMRAVILHDDPVIVINNVRVIDGTGAPAQEGMTLRIEKGRIAAVDEGSGHRKRRTEVQLDGSGKTLLPGFVMLHEHLFYQDVTATPLFAFVSEALNFSALYLAAGATTIRTAGTMHPIDDLQVRRLIRAGRVPGPDIFITAPYIDSAGSAFHQMVPVVTPEAGRQFVRHWVGAGATSFKVYRDIAPDVLGAVIDEAHRLGTTVTGHVCSVTFREAIALGIDNLEHGLTEATDLAGERKERGKCPQLSWKSLDERMDLDNPDVQKLIALLVERKIAITSTLPVYFAGLHPAIPTREALDLLSPRSKEAALKDWAEMLAERGTERDERIRSVRRKEMAFQKALVEAGGILVVGTDPTGWGLTLPPNSTHAALILLTEAGFSPLQAISLATLGGAKFLGIDTEVGTITRGKRANLVLVDGAPDKDITQIGKVSIVFRDGVAYNPKALIERARGKVGR